MHAELKIEHYDFTQLETGFLISLYPQKEMKHVVYSCQSHHMKKE